MQFYIIFVAMSAALVSASYQFSGSVCNVGDTCWNESKTDFYPCPANKLSCNQ
ncbi:hypothetical protein PTTW11_09253 [Pyrenophora teres f. teres]|uniref:Uncharacterized protein n=1 Tax=Pyrenophora teres f. teres TaxID=97479 RepID=A0A6S6WCK2_9PLEO|nr:hypothetical protein PTTW11_09253 [Pyrenophora teres f. teres]